MRFFAAAFIVFLSMQAYGQCCPYFESATINPTSPTEADYVVLNTVVTTPNLGEYLGATVTQTGNQIKVRACYYSGMPTALQTYNETVNIGTLPAGDYELVFWAVLADEFMNCQNAIDSVSHNLAFSVLPDTTSSIGQVLELDWQIVPNPASTSISITLMQPDMVCTVSDVSGRVWYREAVTEAPIDIQNWPQGIYMVRLEAQVSGRVSVKRFLKI